MYGTIQYVNYTSNYYYFELSYALIVTHKKYVYYTFSNNKKFALSYLTNRKQIVVIDGHKSNIENITAGCPQGSKLGPILFLIFINDIQKDKESEILLFADDTSLLASGKDPAETTSILNRYLSKI